MKIAAIAVLMLTGCSLADLRPAAIEDVAEPSRDLETKGRSLLREVVDRNGYDKLVSAGSYEVTFRDHYRGMLGVVGNPWPFNNALLRARLVPLAFDSAAEVLEGKKKGMRMGMQSFETWHQKSGKELRFTDNSSQRFVLAAQQYFIELPLRLVRAPIVQYGGQETFDGETFDVVFATWERLEPNKVYDQYLLYIDQQRRPRMVVNTLRESPLPAPKGWYGSNTYSDFRTVDGVTLPFRITTYLNDAEPNDREKYLHQMTIESVCVGCFDPQDVRVRPSTEPLSDTKAYLAE